MYKHGESKTRLYKIWNSMKQRCLSEKFKDYHYYGGRGIKVCDEWLDYINFRDWSITHGYADNLTIDRINNDGNYEPCNCRWVTVKENCRNMSTNIHIQCNGRIMRTHEIVAETNLNAKLIYQRRSRGWSDERIYNTPVNIKNRQINYKGKNYTVKEFADMFGLTEETVRNRLRRNWSVEKLAAPLQKPKKIIVDDVPYTVYQLADKFKVNRKTIYSLLEKGKSDEEISSILKGA